MRWPEQAHCSQQAFNMCGTGQAASSNGVGMAFYLLSFHGALVGFTGQRLHPLCPTMGTSRTTAPVALDMQHNTLTPGGAFVRAQPLGTAAHTRPLVALRLAMRIFPAAALPSLMLFPCAPRGSIFCSSPPKVLTCSAPCCAAPGMMARPLWGNLPAPAMNCGLARTHGLWSSYRPKSGPTHSPYGPMRPPGGSHSGYARPALWKT